MRRSKIKALALLVGFSMTISQVSAGEDAPPQQLAKVIEALSSCVVMLVGTAPDGKPSVGTAFLLSSERKLYLVTAAHVADTVGAESQITLRASEDKPRNLKLKELSGAPGTQTWHRSTEADLAILVLEPANDIRPHLDAHFAPLSLLAAEESAPQRDAVLTVLGFPLALGVRESFSPILRETKAASGLLTIPETGRPTRFFLTQDPTIGGFSGAPIFDLKLPAWTSARTLEIRGGGPQVVGIAVATISDNTGGKLGVIVPSFYIARILRTLGESFSR